MTDNLRAAVERRTLTFREFSKANLARCESPQGFKHALSSWTASDWMTAFMGEVGEAANIVKKLNRYRDGVPGNKESEAALRDKLRKELGDAFVYLDLMCQSQGFTVDEAAVEVFNAKSAEIGYPALLAQHPPETAGQLVPHRPETAGTSESTSTVDGPDHTAGVCQGCGGAYRFDTVVPSPIWNRVIRARELPEYLCTTCIVRAFAGAGESFDATLWGDTFDGLPMSVAFNGSSADTITALESDNTALRRQLAAPASRGDASRAGTPTDATSDFAWTVDTFAEHLRTCSRPAGDCGLCHIVSLILQEAECRRANAR